MDMLSFRNPKASKIEKLQESGGQHDLGCARVHMLHVQGKISIFDLAYAPLALIHAALVAPSPAGQRSLGHLVQLANSLSERLPEPLIERVGGLIGRLKKKINKKLKPLWNEFLGVFCGLLGLFFPGTVILVTILHKCIEFTHSFTHRLSQQIQDDIYLVPGSVLSIYLKVHGLQTAYFKKSV